MNGGEYSTMSTAEGSAELIGGLDYMSPLSRDVCGSLTNWPEPEASGLERVGRTRRLFVVLTVNGAEPVVSRRRIRRNGNSDKIVTTCEASSCKDQLAGVPSKCSHARLALLLLDTEVEEAESELSEEAGDSDTDCEDEVAFGDIPLYDSDSGDSDYGLDGSGRSCYSEPADSDSDSDAPKRDRPYAARQKRGLFACAGDIVDLDRLEELGRDALSTGALVQICDGVGFCRKCGTQCDVSTPEMQRGGTWRQTAIISLRIPVFYVDVLDWQCQERGCEDMTTHFDGYDCGLVAVSRDRAYARPVLDLVFSLVCANGLTYRDAISSLARMLGHQSCSTLADENEAFPYDRAMRLAMKVFIGLLGDARGNPGSMSVFTKCPCDLPSGEIRCLLLDGTGTGSLGRLPDFEQEHILIPAMKPAGAEKRFLVRGIQGGQHSREALRFILRDAASNNAEEGEVPLDVPVTSKNRKRRATILARQLALSEFIENPCAVSLAASGEVVVGHGGEPLESLDWADPNDLLPVRVGPDGDLVKNSAEGAERRIAAIGGEDDLLGRIGLNFLAAFLKVGNLGASGSEVGESDGVGIASGNSGLQVEHVIHLTVPGAEALRANACALGIATLSDECIFLAKSVAAERALIPYAQALHQVGESCSLPDAVAVIRHWGPLLSPGSAPREDVAAIARSFWTTLASCLCSELKRMGRAGSRTSVQDQNRDVLSVCQLARSAADLLVATANTAAHFRCTVFPENASAAALRYEEEYSNLARDDINSTTASSAGNEISWLNEAKRTGHFYPDRVEKCAGVAFADSRGRPTVDAHSCSKDYVTGKNLSAGLIVASCGCSEPIGKGFTVMTEKEAISMIV